jgi:hypothetical protein
MEQGQMEKVHKQEDEKENVEEKVERMEEQDQKEDVEEKAVIKKIKKICQDQKNEET